MHQEKLPPGLRPVPELSDEDLEYHLDRGKAAEALDEGEKDATGRVRGWANGFYRLVPLPPDDDKTLRSIVRSYFQWETDWRRRVSTSVAAFRQTHPSLDPKQNNGDASVSDPAGAALSGERRSMVRLHIQRMRTELSPAGFARLSYFLDLTLHGQDRATRPAEPFTNPHLREGPQPGN
ncbi:MAG: hypothetical protein IPL96_07820 [Holophagaceae bacterium]|nr:hypothetical protein [Holophagaceae bacterium]